MLGTEWPCPFVHTTNHSSSCWGQNGIVPLFIQRTIHHHAIDITEAFCSYNKLFIIMPVIWLRPFVYTTNCSSSCRWYDWGPLFIQWTIHHHAGDMTEALCLYKEITITWHDYCFLWNNSFRKTLQNNVKSNACWCRWPAAVPSDSPHGDNGWHWQKRVQYLMGITIIAHLLHHHHFQGSHTKQSIKLTLSPFILFSCSFCSVISSYQYPPLRFYQFTPILCW